MTATGVNKDAFTAAVTAMDGTDMTTVSGWIGAPTLARTTRSPASPTTTVGSGSPAIVVLSAQGIVGRIANGAVTMAGLTEKRRYAGSLQPPELRAHHARHN